MLYVYVAFFMVGRFFAVLRYPTSLLGGRIKELKSRGLGFPERALMGDGCGNRIGGGCGVGANGVECVALMLGCSLVVCVSFFPVASFCALRAQGG